jgi:UPF0755 protein
MLRRTVRAVLVATVILVPALTGWLVRELFAPAGRGLETVFFEVEKGRTARGVIDRLHDRGLLRSALALRLACRLFYPEESFKAGEYRFSQPVKPKEAIFQIFGGRIHLQPITVPEGLTGREIAELVWPGDAEASAAFERAFLDAGPIADLDPRARTLEGYLYPNTYNLPRKAPAADLVAAMVAEFRQVFDEERRQRAAELGLTVRDVVTLASLIEKETALADERPLVSAVFHNRLKIGMKLDCDPTVVYALELEGRYAGRLLLKDLKFASPYNTYLNAGLPPGPIANPGMSSLDAALHPAAEKFLYFVAQGDGHHRFSRTLGEHNDAVRKLRALKNN